MKRLLLCCLILSALIFAAKKERDWKTGKITDSVISQGQYTWGHSTTTANTTGTISPDYGAGSTVRTTTTATTTGPHSIPIETTTLTVRGDEYEYKAQTNRRRGCRFIVGDETKYAQEKRNFYVIDADGKECRLNIVRQERRR